MGPRTTYWWLPYCRCRFPCNLRTWIRLCHSKGTCLWSSCRSCASICSYSSRRRIKRQVEGPWQRSGWRWRLYPYSLPSKLIHIQQPKIQVDMHLNPRSRRCTDRTDPLVSNRSRQNLWMLRRSFRLKLVIWQAKEGWWRWTVGHWPLPKASP